MYSKLQVHHVQRGEASPSPLPHDTPKTKAFRSDERRLKERRRSSRQLTGASSIKFKLSSAFTPPSLWRALSLGSFRRFISLHKLHRLKLRIKTHTVYSVQHFPFKTCYFSRGSQAELAGSSVHVTNMQIIRVAALCRLHADWGRTINTNLISIGILDSRISHSTNRMQKQMKR